MDKILQSKLKQKNESNKSDEKDENEYETYDVYEDENTFLLKTETSRNRNKSYSIERSYSEEDSDYENSFAETRNINSPVYDEFDSTKNEEKTFLKYFYLKNNIFIKTKNLALFLFQKCNQFFKTNSSFLKNLKTAILVIYSLLCIILFSLNDSKEIEWTQTVISNQSENKYSCFNELHYFEHLSAQFIRFKINGPFIEEADLDKNDLNTGKFIIVNIYTILNSTYTEQISHWKLIQRLSDQTDTNKFTKSFILTKNFDLKSSFNLNQVKFSINTNIKDFISFNFNCSKLSNQFKYSVLYAALLLIFIYFLIIFELIHRTLAAFLGSIGGISLLSLVETERPTLNTIVTWVEWETILLMFGMMIIVAIFCETGLFDLIAVRIFHYSSTRIWLMICSLCLLSAILSAFLDNVTTILLLTPITIRLCEVMNLNPRYIIIAEVIFSNIGGTSTAIGDPPNVILTANQVINSRGIDFSTFTLHMFLGSVFVYVICYLNFRLLYADPNNFLKEEENELDEMKKEINIWTRSFQSIIPITKEEKIVKTLLKEKVSQLENLLTQKRFKVKEEFIKTLETKSQEMIENYKITNKPLLIKCSIIFAGTLILFFINPFIKSIYLTIGWISILSALVLLTSSTNSDHNNSENVIDFESLMHKIEWSTLLFFSGLFIFMKCIEELGLLDYLGNTISDWIKSVENVSDRIVIALLMLIILSALISSIIDNIPFTTAMIPIIIQLSDEADLPLRPLVYALAFGSCLGGNGSLIGASCNLVAAGIAEQHGYKITFKDFFKVSFPIMISSILVAIVYVLVTCIYMKWD